MDVTDSAEPSHTRKMVWHAFIRLILPAVAVILSLTSTLMVTADLPRFPIAIIAALGGIGLAAAFTFILARHERGPSHVAKLKSNVASAYLNALDSSTLNPLRSRGL